MANNENGEALLLREYDEAWAHYRHLESTRAQYLGFLFTVALATGGVAIPVLRTDVFTSPSGLLAAAVFLLVFTILCSVIYVSVRKLGAVLYHYERVQNMVRDYFFGSGWLPFEYGRLSVRSDSNPILKTRWFRIQSAAECAIVVFQFLALVLQIVIVVQLIRLNAAVWTVPSALIVTAVNLGCDLLPLVAGRASRASP